MKDEGEDDIMRTHASCLISVAYTGPDWEGRNRRFLRQERMKIKEKKMKEDVKKKKKKQTSHIPLVLRFHGNHFHNTVTFRGAYGAAYVFLTRLWPHKRKAMRG